MTVSPPTPAPLRLLVVDDHPRIREPLALYLRRQGLKVDTAGTLREMRVQLDLHAYDLVVLDVMLPDGDGSQACREVRVSHATPVILLTARGALDDRVNGLEAGADDYVIKPFEPRELLARIRSVARRQAPGDGMPGRGVASSTPTAPADPAIDPRTGGRRDPVRDLGRLRIDDWHFDAARARLDLPDGTTRLLSEREARLLLVLASHAPAVLSRSDLLDLTRTQGREGDDAYDRTIDRQISRLRRKLVAATGDGPALRTVRGDGYALLARVERQDD